MSSLKSSALGRVPSFNIVERCLAAHDDAPRLAILPFVTRSAELDRCQLDGMLWLVTMAFASLPELRVLGPSTVLEYQGAGKSRRAMARDLLIDYTLNIDVDQRRGVYIFHFELHAARSDRRLLTGDFKAALDDLHEIEHRIVAPIVSNIAPRVRSAEVERALHKNAKPTAYHLTLKAWALILGLRRGDFPQASTYLAEAIERDPDYALPHALLARLYSLRLGQSWAEDRDAETKLCWLHAERAIGLEPDNSLALATAGHLRSYIMQDLTEGLRLLDLSISACYSDPLAWSMSSATLSYLGRTSEARLRAEHAVRLSPFDQSAFNFYSFAGLACYLQQDYEAAEEWLFSALERNSSYTTTLKLLCATLAARGNARDAKKVAARLHALEPSFVSNGARKLPIADLETAERYRRHLRKAGAIRWRH